MGLPWLWLIGGAVVGPLFGLFFKVWNKLDDQTKKLIIETVVNAFEEILRAYYNWWKQKGESA